MSRCIVNIKYNQQQNNVKGSESALVVDTRGERDYQDDGTGRVECNGIGW